MTYFDVFNGDADGICALHQLRLANPQDAQLITGVKRDIALAKQVTANAGDTVTILDISLEKNIGAVQDILASGASITYVDHHFPGEYDEHANFNVHIDTAAETCTSLIVNTMLKGAHLPWAVVAAYGDNLDTSAREAAKPLALNDKQLDTLKTLGTLLNYNGYGSALEDLHFPPADLYQSVKAHKDPFEFIQEDSAFSKLQTGYQDDYAQAKAIAHTKATDSIAVYVFPNDAYARRISGVYANELAQKHPDRAHALLSEIDDGSFLVSVRAPINNRTGADDLCRQFETGGGRKAAAGINRLPVADMDKFIDAMAAQFNGA